MPFRSQLARFSLALAVALILTLFIFPASPQAIPSLRVQVGDTTGNSDEINSVITVYLDNFVDTVAAFELWLQLSSPDILIFQTNDVVVHDTTWWACLPGHGAFPNCSDSIGLNKAIDTMYFKCTAGSFNTTCTDSIRVDSVLGERRYIWTAQRTYVKIDTVATGNIDTAGTLMRGWQYVQTRSITETGYDVKVTATADAYNVPGVKKGIAPQQGGVLFRLLGDIKTVADTASDRTVNIIPQGFLEHFSFSRPNGTAIGLTTKVVTDTNYYHCDSWAGPVCLHYTKVPKGDPYDSVWIVLDTVPILDTVKTKLIPGSLTVLGGQCGNVDGQFPVNVDIGDLTALITFMFLFGDEPPAGTADMDCSPGIDIGDLTRLITYMFLFGPGPCECP